MEENLHKGHRQKVKDKYLKMGGLDAFADHEILELLLFYAYPMKDTNPIAHKFLKEYTSLYELMSDSPENIQKRLKVTENVSVLLTLIPHIYKRYMLSSQAEKPVIDTFEKASLFLQNILEGLKEERVYALFLDARKRLVKYECVSEGSVSVSLIYSDKIAKRALMENAEFIILSHNHPAGSPLPSQEDIETTKKVKNALMAINIMLIDHIIVSGNDYRKNFSFAKNGLI